MRNCKMNLKLLTFPSAFLFVSMVSGAAELTAQLNGTIKVKVASERHHRHSGDCYVLKKGNTLTQFPDQELPLEGGHQSMKASGSVAWTSQLGSPFQRQVRHLTMSVKIEERAMDTKIQAHIQDHYQYQKEQYDHNKCNHWDGITNPVEASIAGSIEVRYEVPSGVWLLALNPGEFQGLYNAKTGIVIEGGLEGKKDGLRQQTNYIWVTPGSKILIQFHFPEQVLGHSNFLQMALQIRPVGVQTIDFPTVKALADKILRDRESAAERIQFADAVLAFQRNPSGFNEALASTDIQEATTLSDMLHGVSKKIIRDPQLGLTVKTAAAFGAFSLGYGVLQELSKYCKTVEVDLPFTGQKVEVSGLRAAGFWLTRSLAVVRNYSFADFHSLLTELEALQAKGYTYAQIYNQPQLRKRIKAAFELIDRTVDMVHSPMMTAAHGVRRTLETVGHVGRSDREAHDLLEQLKTMVDLENRFFEEYDRIGDSFKPSHQQALDVSAARKMLSELQEGQKSLESSMTQTIRLLALGANEDKTAVFTQFTNLLSHQINVIYEENPSVPHFEKIRKVFKASGSFQEVIETSKACVLGGLS